MRLGFYESDGEISERNILGDSLLKRCGRNFKIAFLMNTIPYRLTTTAIKFQETLPDIFECQDFKEETDDRFGILLGILGWTIQGIICGEAINRGHLGYLETLGLFNAADFCYQAGKGGYRRLRAEWNKRPDLSPW